MVNWNTTGVTLECVQSVLKSDYPSLSLLVVDNGSRAEELDLLRSGLPEGVGLLPLDRNYGYVGGVNQGLKEVEGTSPEYVMVMNNDTLIDATAISELVQASIRHANKCIVTGVVYDHMQPELIQQTGSICVNRRKLSFKPLYRSVRDPGLPDHDMKMDMIDDVFWLMHTTVFKSVGYYCEFFWFNDEQADYALRARKKGYNLVFTPKAKLWHMGSLSIGGRSANPVREYFDIKSRLILRYQHLSKLDFAGYYLETLVSLVRSTLRARLRPSDDCRQTRKLALARFYGFRDFHRWIIRKKPDSGCYPPALKGNMNA